jgi:hypothetical protein
LHKDFGGIVPAFIKHSNHFDLISLFQRRYLPPPDAAGAKGEPQLFFQVTEPAPKAFRFIACLSG